jgi:glycosyltransferase involved in cell wall biosynthesis
MASRLAIYHPAARVGVGTNPFGKDVANAELYRALARHGGYEQIDVLANLSIPAADVAAGLLQGRVSALRIESSTILNQSAPAAAGALLRGQPDLEALAWHRRGAVGDRAYSLMGLVHTIAPPAMRDTIGRALTAPVQPWDAIICTSPSIQAALGDMLGEWGDYLAARFGGARRPEVRLPLVPLGVDLESLAAQADRPEARAALRAELGLGEADILVLWVGRLSFFEKAFPQAMFRALEQAAQATGARIHFVMAGWFPNAAQQQPWYEEAARVCAPSVAVHFMDGNDRDLLGRLWAGADIFLSLVDNIQETFGITPLEAMASRLPVVASDWDGYRYTMRHGVEAFLVPTLGGPPGPLGQRMIDRHALLLDSYQNYVGLVAQHTAVHVGKCAEALAALIRSPELRARMGAAGRERVRTAFDWPVVARMYGALQDELAEVRAKSAGSPEGPRCDPVRADPFRSFAGFANEVLGPQTRLSLAPGASIEMLLAANTVELDRWAASWRGTLDECVQALRWIEQASAPSVLEVLDQFPPPRRPYVSYALTWMAKTGLLDWS